MAIVSKYSNEQVEELLHELLLVLEKRKTPTDLALMALGNAATVLINSKVSPAVRGPIAEQFAEALKASVNGRSDA
ncbi:protein of unknown function DUF1414 [Ferrimonas balearica DSM 9799]|uniref:UPF0352 protein Fbal_1612 n=1 Tax=Ferrimonas balearica (strain DSM 9799 / CCM 4581 / KCTC 23876 / PAT) TaxID=550540 RepID=E1SQL8_FERBD|nr:DUF1414 domain-containing protein [Ferrimonas balearica]MBY6016287.1 DUF1414 domain-containing protein [Halomonas denitrificans]ADN75816.1 protein of unknown function DUF1414 [Ferrimonas balearica DSM 9799]MBW3138709.1 DUF1414 domain-containing protein [Ferrimonas balearica]MBW3163685.1 DUF1414 domain-containing protein [Ferrimonas balearica]MBY5979502.1 DUF1414 domain-containing protein [Ferrimonas balearica]